MNFKRKLWWAQHKNDVYKYSTFILLFLIVTISIIYFTCSKFSSSNEMTMYETTVEPFIKNDYFIASYIEGEWSNEIPGKNDGYVVDKVICDNGATGTWDNDKWAITIENAIKKIKCSVYFKEKKQFDFDYTGAEQVFTVPKTGKYKLETWGAQGGDYYNYYAGLGGYSIGTANFEAGDTIYVIVGGKGENGILNIDKVPNGGYNGGGAGGKGIDSSLVSGGGGGGATSIQSTLIKDGQLKNYENNKENILIVSGGGGGGGGYSGYAGSAGGFKSQKSLQRTADNFSWGGNSMAATQTSGYAFGKGQDSVAKTTPGGYGSEGNGGGGGGYYGGFANVTDGDYSNDAGAGGSSYIGNSLLTNKVMYCYGCEESSEESTKTISTTCAEETPTENCAKKGNGYARITYID